MFFQPIILGLLLFVSSSFALYDGSSDVVELTPSNFDKLVLKSDEVWIVEFYAPWCGHCKNLAPEYKKAATALKGVVKVGAIDADVHRSLSQQYGVTGFPTLKIFSGGKHTPYQGDRTADAIVTAALKAAKDKVYMRMGKKGDSSADKQGSLRTFRPQPMDYAPIHALRRSARREENIRDSDIQQNKRNFDIQGRNLNIQSNKRNLDTQRRNLDIQNNKRYLDTEQNERNLDIQQNKRNLDIQQNKRNFDIKGRNLDLDIQENIQQIKRNLDTEQYKRNLDIQQIKRNLDIQQNKRNLDIQQIKRNLDTEQNKRNLNTEQNKRNLAANHDTKKYFERLREYERAREKKTTRWQPLTTPDFNQAPFVTTFTLGFQRDRILNFQSKLFRSDLDNDDEAPPVFAKTRLNKIVVSRRWF